MFATKTSKKLILWGLIVFPIIMVITFITLPIIDKFSPFEVAKSELEHRNSRFALCVGISSSKATKNGMIKSHYKRSYMLLSECTVITIFENKTGEGVAVGVSESKITFWILCIFFTLMMYLVFRFSIPRIRNQHSRSAQNADLCLR